MNIHIDPVSTVTFMKIFSRLNNTSENIFKTNPTLVLDFNGRYQDIGHILQNPKLSWNAMGFNNHNLSQKSLKRRALDN